MATLPNAENTKTIIGEIADRVQKEYDAMKARLIADAKAHPEWAIDVENIAGATDKIEAMVLQEIRSLTAGDVSVIVKALSADVTALIKTGKSGVSKSAADIA